MKKFIAFAALTLCLAAAGQAQQIYKWVDEDGTVHFTDAPPEQGRQAERVALRNTTSIEEAAEAGVDPDELDLLYTPAQRQLACERARTSRGLLGQPGPVRMDLDRDGEPEELTEEQKAAELAKAERRVELLCRDPD